MSANGRDIFSGWPTWSDARLELRGYLDAATIERLDEAMTFALARHAGQTRPHGEPYAEHLFEVLEILVVGAGVRDADVLVAAVLHDVVEDTSTSLEEVTERFGAGVAALVKWLTKSPGDGDDVRTTYLTGLRDAPAQAIVVKLADRLSNVQRLDTHPRPAKRASYYRETVDHFLPLAASHPWFSRQFAQWREAFRHLEQHSDIGAVPNRGGQAS
jgi:guanosine-3',5'-bis(diphosphate) 3'-pyrophosphohydrolase